MKLLRRPIKSILPALLLVAPIVAVAQSARPAVEYQSLLNIKFDEAEGDLVIDNLNVLFPPGAYERAILSVSTAAGEEVTVVPFRLDSYLSFPIFSRFVPEVGSTAIKLRRSGDFIISIKVADEVITRFPLTLAAEPTSNPYDPPKRFTREGPWRDFAYFSTPAINGSGNLVFNWWMSTRELPIGMKAPAITIHLRDDYKEIAAGSKFTNLKSVDWQFFSGELTMKKKTGPQPLTMRDLVQRDATYLLIVKADGIPIKSFQLQTSDGRLQRAEQSRMGFQPQGDFMSPRFIESRRDSDRILADAYWVRRSGVLRSFPPLAASSIVENQR